MDQKFCKQIDDEDLIEKYIAGNLQGELLHRLTEHLAECQMHSQAVNLERALSRGVRDFARSELKTKLRFQIKKHEISKYYILRYAAVLIVAVMAPIILYYQIVSEPSPVQSIAESPTPAPAVQYSEDIVEPEEAPVITAPAAERSKDIKSTEKIAPVATSSSRQEQTRYLGAKPQKIAKQATTVFINDTEYFHMNPMDLAVKDSIYNIIRSIESELIKCIPDPEAISGDNFIIIVSLAMDGKILEIMIEPASLFSATSRKCISDKFKAVNFPVLKDTTIIKKRIRFE
jgi:hypothetical protein